MLITTQNVGESFRQKVEKKRSYQIRRRNRFAKYKNSHNEPRPVTLPGKGMGAGGGFETASDSLFLELSADFINIFGL